MNPLSCIGGFDVLSVLGHGASSTIYAVRRHDGKAFALKHVVRKDKTDQKFIVQARNEFQIAAHLDHPMVRKVYEIRNRRVLLRVSEIFMLMEMVEGQTLAQHRPDLLVELLGIFVRVADCLGAIHRAAFVHADVKPNNILVSKDLGVKVIDLGQSCPMGTVKTRIQGTPDFIAPEQVRCRPLTARTDIFNFGATMYWCVTGRAIPTLIPQNDNELVRKQDRIIVPPLQLNQQLPPALNHLIMSCLAYRPEQRPESMADVIRRLELARHQTNPHQPTLADPAVCLARIE